MNVRKNQICATFTKICGLLSLLGFIVVLIPFCDGDSVDELKCRQIHLHLYRDFYVMSCVRQLTFAIKWEANDQSYLDFLFDYRSPFVTADAAEFAVETEIHGYQFNNFKYLNANLPNSHGLIRHYRAVCIPQWSLLILFAIFPSIYLIKKLCSKRYGKGFCLKCGYDLRATPNTCPECGSVVGPSR